MHCYRPNVEYILVVAYCVHISDAIEQEIDIYSDLYVDANVIDDSSSIKQNNTGTSQFFATNLQL